MSSIDWPQLIVPGFIVAWIVAVWWRKRRAAHRAHVLALIAEAKRQEEVYDPYCTQALVDAAEYIVHDHHADIIHMFPDDGTTQWPDLCADKPCNWEDNYQCKAHRPPRGKHHVVHTITDLPEPSDPWWTR